MSEPLAGLSVRLHQDSPIPLDAELACAPGEVLALVGPSGSGKSTILRTIAGLYSPRHGRISCGNRPWLDTDTDLDLPTVQRRVGMVFQSYALFPHLSAIENVMQAMEHCPRAARREQAQSLLERVHLVGLANRRPAELSGGQQQRVAVARALAREPEVLLLDEPFSAVDRATRESLYEELAELRRGLDIPMLLVTHDLDEATLLADRMCVLAGGKILQSGTPATLMDCPASTEVARLNGMKNIFDGVVIAQEPQQTLIRWNHQTLYARPQPQWPCGEAISWICPPAAISISMQGSNRGSNAINAVVDQSRPWGETLRVMLQFGSLRLEASLPRRLAAAHNLEPGLAVQLHLAPEHIQIMPAPPG